MLILSALWLAYTIFRLARLCIDRFNKKTIKVSQIIELLSDFCLCINLLLWGLALNGLLSIESFIFVIPVAIYLVLKIIIQKLR